MESMPISEFKATCLAVLERVRTTGQPLLVTRRGKPVAQILPPPPEKKAGSGFGSMKGTARILGDIVGPISSEEEWDAAK
jgi:prevent-host-death family protein